jgi:hypothetical protein
MEQRLIPQAFELIIRFSPLSWGEEYQPISGNQVLIGQLEWSDFDDCDD